ncbi:hypothetical protein HELRODRAFT_67421 [Helobdella robusta]|uniref:BRO1 domain-containing protein n=1 Tax=Helobdella robusta TaxID=6412 RepID=T1FZ06_HELRO|nr:hypothetical protein HELRODRAFT_67421 [Helobdella robusta]ESN98810.1 hypothetical protein HELRODRAFT_67421 [Helobdella robusta]
MEGVPRLPMINFDLKLSTKHVEFSSAIQNFISENYLEDAEKFNRECLEIEKLREQATSVSLDFIGCSSLKKYFCQIEFLLNRFLIKDGGDAFNISFSWEDSMARREVTHNDIRYEQACILFNVGSLHSKLGSMENRLSPEGMKVSCTHFQCAAWAYQHLADKFESYGSADFNRDLLASYATVMLAQAQECILEKSMTDNRKSSITAKVSAQIVDYYKQAIKHLDAFVNSTSINNKQTKEWKKRMLLKLSFYDCITYYYAGLQAEEASQWGQRLAYLKVSTDKLQELMKNNKLEDQAVDESLKFMVDVIGGKYNIAKKDNDFIYHDKVPDEENLSEIKGASLVKGIPLNVDDPGISGADIFMKLVPFKVHQISSMYSEEKAKILRKIGQEVEEKDEEMKNFLNVLQLTTSDSISPPAFTIPESLLEKCASLSVRPDAIKDLSNAMMALSSRSTDVEGDLNATIKIVDGVEQGIQDILDKHGIKLDGLNECNVIRDECSKMNDVLKGASQSNEELHKLMQFHISNLKLLCGSVEELMQIAASHQYKPCTI